MLTIIIPAFNEINTIEEIITRVNKIDFIPIEIILVDDHSTDGSRDLIKKNYTKKLQELFIKQKILVKDLL